jgi:DNA polymerase-3 subunit beta
VSATDEVCRQSGHLAAAVKAAAGALDSRNKNFLILSTVLVDAADDLIRVTGTDLDIFVTAASDADVSESGNVAVPGHNLSALLAGLPSDADVTIANDNRGLTVTAGRAHYRLPALPPDDFPHVPEANTDATLILSRDDVHRLLGTTAFCINRERNQPQLQGAYLHHDGERLACCTCDGSQLALASVPIAANGLPASGVTVPLKAVAAITKLKTDSLALRADAHILEVQAGPIAIVSKLIDLAFPNYRDTIPAPSGNSATVERAALLAALTRITAVHDDRRTIVWDGADALQLMLGNDDVADDSIVADIVGSAQVSVSVERLLAMVDAIDAARLTIDVAGSRRTMRLTSENLLALLATIVGGRT